MLRTLVVVCLAVGTTLPAALPAQEQKDAPEHLPRPFSAEQIRDEWVEGLTLVLRRVDPQGESRERWTVVTADDAGALIEFVPIDAEGRPAGDGRTERSTWDQLRDHATFAAASAKREAVTRDTPLGRYEGWLYVVPDAERGTVTEFFFANALPGAPLEMRVTRDGRVLMEMTQVSRSKPKR